MIRLLLVVVLFTATPLWAADNTPPNADFPALDSRDLFDQAISSNPLQGLFAQALATLHNYVEIETTLSPDEPSRRRAGEFRLKLFPQGKSRSQDYLSAEGSFRLFPDADQQEFTLRFKSSKHPQQPLPPLDNDVI